MAKNVAVQQLVFCDNAGLPYVRGSVDSATVARYQAVYEGSVKDGKGYPFPPIVITPLVNFLPMIKEYPKLADIMKTPAKYVVIAGVQRTMAVMKAKGDTIPANEIDVSTIDRLILEQIKSDAQHGLPNRSERTAQALKTLVGMVNPKTDKKWTVREIGLEVQMSKSSVDRLMRFGTNVTGNKAAGAKVSAKAAKAAKTKAAKAAKVAKAATKAKAAKTLATPAAFFDSLIEILHAAKKRERAFVLYLRDPKNNGDVKKIASGLKTCAVMLNTFAEAAQPKESKNDK